MMAEKPVVPLWATVALAAGVGLAGVVGGYLAGSTATRPAPGAAASTGAGAGPSGSVEAAAPGQATPWAAATADREALIQEHLARNMVFFGDDLMQRIRGAFVVVVGLGGVGSHAAVMLARNGVQRMRIIDFDQVTLSSLNRHAAATYADVGVAKAVVIERMIGRVAPFVSVDARIALFDAKRADELLGGSPDFVLDCIDNVDTKVDLLMYCVQHRIPVISSMGAGAKGDPSRIQIADLSDTQASWRAVTAAPADPLSKSVRRRLKKLGIDEGIPVVYSSEMPDVGLLPLDEEQAANKDAYKTLPNFRMRILPVLGVIPAMFGNAMAAFVLNSLAGKAAAVEPLHIKSRDKLYATLHNHLLMKERDVYKGSPTDVQVDLRDVRYLMEEVWRNRSSISRSPDHILLTRWHRNKPTTVWNVVVLTTREAAAHDKLVNLADGYAPEVIERVQARLDEEERLQQLLHRRGLA